MTKDFNKIRAAFMQRASAPNITPFALKLGYLIAFKYMNRQTRTAHPAQETLARDLNVDQRTIRRLLDILQPLGLTVIPGNGRGWASTYCLDPERTLRESPEKRTPESTFSRQKADSKRRTPDAKKGGLQDPPNLTKRTKIEDRECYALPYPLGEREFALSRESDSCISGGRLDGAAEMVLDATATIPPPRDRKESGEEEIEIADRAEDVNFSCRKRDALNSAVSADFPSRGHHGSQRPSAVSLDDQQRDWRALLELWDRGWASDNTPKAVAIARNAFAKACQEVTPDDILAAAKTWIASADAPRYLPQLARWLAARGWEKPPPAKRGSRERQHRDRLPRSNGRKVDLTRLALKMGGYVEDADGKLYHPDGDAGCSFDWRAAL